MLEVRAGRWAGVMLALSARQSCPRGLRRAPRRNAGAQLVHSWRRSEAGTVHTGEYASGLLREHVATTARVGALSLAAWRLRAQCGGGHYSLLRGLVVEEARNA